MTIDELIERLEEYRDSLGGDTEVRLMTQPNYPFENSIKGLISQEEIAQIDDYDQEDDDQEQEDDAEMVVYIAEGRQLGYGTKRAWECY